MSTSDKSWTLDHLEMPDFAKRLLSSRKVVIGLSVLIPIIIISTLGETITPYDPVETNILAANQGPSSEYWLGTDNLGRDLLSRVIMGGQSSLLLGFSATGFSLALGVPIGLVSGYMRGRVDEYTMRLMDIFMSIPILLLGILILVALPSSLINVIFAIGVVFIPRIARVTRSATLAESQEPYIMAAKARGESMPYILFRELLPNIMPPIVVEGSIRVGYAILVGTSLSFLGLGAGPPNADWGYMVANARLYIYETPWFLLWPSLALLLTIMSTNLVGDGLNDVLDPRAGGDRL